MESGKLVAEFEGEQQYINTFSEDAEGKNGYGIVLDTRPAATTFDDFTVECKDGNGKEISYDEYCKLSEEVKEKSTAELIYSGKALNVAANLGEYEEYVNKISNPYGSEYNEPVADAYAELKQRYESGELSAQGYADCVYILYFNARYKDFAGKDLYGEAPTLRTYYMSLEGKSVGGKYILLLDDVCLCAFKTDGGITVDFAAYFSKTADMVISSEDTESAQIRANVDKFVAYSFRSGISLIFFVYVFSLFRVVTPFLIITVLIAIITFAVCRVRRLEFGSKFMGTLKITGSFWLVSALAALLNSLIFSFVVARGTVYILSLLLFIAIVAVRMIVLIVAESVKSSRNSRKAAEEEN